MDNAKFQDWRKLHVRAARGEQLSESEERIYEEGLKEVHQEEQIDGDLMRVREARARVAALELENLKLREQQDRLNNEIGEIEAALSQEARQLLGVEE